MFLEKRVLLIAVVLLGSCLTVCLGREVVDFDSDWKFSLGDFEKASEIGFDDSSWRALDLPHDWAFEADYDANAAQKDRGGYKPGGIGWYRKDFEIDKSWQSKRVFIEFEAVYMNSEVWVNGKLLGKRPYGYISFDYEMTGLLKPGKNSIAVRVDSSLEPSARWYHGCGIYAHVKLVATEAVRIAKDGVYVTTPVISDSKAKVVVETEIENSTSLTKATLETTILDADGLKVASDVKSLGAKVRQELSIRDPKLWDTSSPYLYKVVSRVLVGGKCIDELVTRIGVRSVRWETKTGFWLNDKNVKLLGVSDHLECGPVGAASPDELIRWKIQLLKDMGCNAIRTAHNPQVPIFYDLCDEMGMLVMDEVFDGWKKKASQDYGKQAFSRWWEIDLSSWIKRDRNHACVFVWSVGNETRGAVGAAIVKVCHEVDSTRKVTSGGAASGVMDVMGGNGHSETMHFFNHAPKKPFVSTEAPHTWQVRGYYRSKSWFRDGYSSKKQRSFPCPDLTDEEIFTYDWTSPENRKNRKQIFNSSYDNAMVRITARKNWELMRDLPWHSGHFRWTGFDYVGEAGYVHGGWPFRAFMGGALDLAGFEKDLYYFYQSQWTEKPMVHILPHWTHPKMKAGTKIPVWVYSNCDEVELFVNGKSLGKDKPGKQWDQMQCEWLVPWTPGKVEAVGYRGGKVVGRASQITAGVPAKLAVSVEGDKCPIVTVKQIDDKGVMNPYAENRIHYHIDGPARILSLESGNPVNTENNFTNTSRAAFFGLGRGFLQTTKDTGDISVVVGAISGDKNLMISNKISIGVKSAAVRGALKKYDFKVLYSTNGSKPNKVYEGSFAVKDGVTVKSDVYNGDELLFSMSEKFGTGEGIYWQREGEVVVADAGGDQAEDASFKGAKVSSRLKGFNGKGYVEFANAKGAYVEWYQENDGSGGKYDLEIRYSGQAKGENGNSMKLTVNGKVVNPKLLFPNTKGRGKAWRTVKVKVKVKLGSGANTVRLTAVDDCIVNIDEISLK